MIVDITNEIITKLKLELPTVKVLASYPITVPTFPCAIVEEQSNIVYDATIDSSGQQHSDVTLEINIFSNAKNKTTEVKEIRNNIDVIMTEVYGMYRGFASPTPNYLDENVYRYTLRYNGIVDKNKTIFRR